MSLLYHWLPLPPMTYAKLRFSYTSCPLRSTSNSFRPIICCDPEFVVMHQKWFSLLKTIRKFWWNIQPDFHAVLWICVHGCFIQKIVNQIADFQGVFNTCTYLMVDLKNGLILPGVSIWIISFHRWIIYFSFAEWNSMLPKILSIPWGLLNNMLISFRHNLINKSNG